MVEAMRTLGEGGIPLGGGGIVPRGDGPRGLPDRGVEPLGEKGVGTLGDEAGAGVLGDVPGAGALGEAAVGAAGLGSVPTGLGTAPEAAEGAGIGVPGIGPLGIRPGVDTRGAGPLGKEIRGVVVVAGVKTLGAEARGATGRGPPAAFGARGAPIVGTRGLGVAVLEPSGRWVPAVENGALGEGAAPRGTDAPPGPLPPAM